MGTSKQNDSYFPFERGWKFSADNFNFTTTNQPNIDDDVQDSMHSPLSIYIKALMYIMYTTITVAAIFGNGIVCYIVFAYQKMRTVTNFFIVNLAVGDILMAILCIPFTFVSNLVLMYWPFGAIMCPVVTYAQAVTVFISAYTMVAISIDRYIAIIYPLRPRMTKLQAKGCILLVWIVALVTPLPTVIKSRLHRPDNWRSDDHYICTEVWETTDQNYCYSIVLTILQYLFPLSALIFTYARIGIVVWGKRVPGEAQDSRDQKLAASKRKMVKMMITVVLIFTLCWLPFNTLLVVGQQDDSIWSLPGLVYVWFILHWLAMSHACCNPIIYCWMNARFRDGFRRIFRHCIRSSRNGISGSIGKSKQGKRHLDDGLKRCNTYTTSYTSVRTTSIRGGGGGGGHLNQARIIYTNKQDNHQEPDSTSGFNHHQYHHHQQPHNQQQSPTHEISETRDHYFKQQNELRSFSGSNNQDRDQFQSSYDDDPITSETNI